MPDDDFMELGDTGFFVGENEIYNPKTGEVIKDGEYHDEDEETEDDEDS